MNGTGDVIVAVPTRWQSRSDPQHEVVVAARPPRVPASGHCPEVVVRRTMVDTDLTTWRDTTMAELAQRLPGFALEDADTFDLGDHLVAYRRFAHASGAVDVLSDQWAWLVDGVGVTLTCSVAREDYPAYCDVFERIAETVDVLPGVA